MMIRRLRRKIRLRTVAVFGFAAVMGALLLRTSQSVQQAEERLAILQAAISEEQDSIRLLNAEWAYLNNPERLEKLNAEFLHLMPPQPAAILSATDQIPAKTTEVLNAIDPTKAQPISLNGGKL